MNKQSITFEEVYDLTALRIVTDTKMNCYAVLGVIHSVWRPVPGRFKDYIAIPKSNLYQSLHTTVVGPKGEHVEFQIRTEEMHRIAEHGIAAHWKYKEQGHVADRDSKAFGWLHQFVEWHEDLTDNRQFMDSVKLDLFHDVVYVFTPKGIVKELPRGSTPVDFAFAIHTAGRGPLCRGQGGWEDRAAQASTGQRRYGRNSDVSHAIAAQRLVEVCPHLAREDQDQTLDQARRTEAEYRDRPSFAGVGVPPSGDGAGPDVQIGGTLGSRSSVGIRQHRRIGCGSGVRPRGDVAGHRQTHGSVDPERRRRLRNVPPRVKRWVERATAPAYRSKGLGIC